MYYFTNQSRNFLERLHHPSTNKSSYGTENQKSMRRRYFGNRCPPRQCATLIHLLTLQMNQYELPLRYFDLALLIPMRCLCLDSITTLVSLDLPQNKNREISSTSKSTRPHPCQMQSQLIKCVVLLLGNSFYLQKLSLEPPSYSHSCLQHALTNWVAQHYH